MQVQIRKRLGLLSRVSTLAIIAAATGGLGAVQQAEAAGCASSVTLSGAGNQTVSSNVECVTADGVTPGISDNGDVTVAAHVGDPGVGFPSFFVGKGGISGELLNNSLIVGGHTDTGSSTYGALTIEGDVLGGIRNEGQITSSTGNAVQIGFTNGGEATSGALTGNITNNAGIAGGLSGNGIAALYGTMSGQLINNSHGVITGGDAAVDIADTFTSWSGGIYNNGTLHGDNAGIQIGQPGSHNVVFSGGIYNDYSGAISSVNGGPAIFAGGASYDGGLTNYGVITETGSLFTGSFGGTGVVFDATTVGVTPGGGDVTNYGEIDGFFRQGVLVTNNVANFNGSISNYNYIDGAEGGVVVLAQTVSGNFNNTGLITGGIGAGVLYSNNTIQGSGGEGTTATFNNTGSIIGANGFLIFANTVNADFTNGDEYGQGLIQGTSTAGVVLDANSWTGNISNTGTILGYNIGLAVGYDPFTGKSGGDYTGSLTNTGTIGGSEYGIVIGADSFDGNFDNQGIITASGESGVAVQIGGVGTYYGAQTFTGDISNSGTMHGNETGLAILVDTYDGSGGEGFSNSGSIVGDNGAGVYVNVNTWKGDFTNKVGGFIQGASEGVFINGGSIAGDFSNAGTIIGGFNGNAAGVYIQVDSWQGNLTNQSGGYIQGDVDGFFMNAGTIAGDFANYGTIIGLGFDTGLHIQTPAYTGNIANGVGGVLSAPSNALHLEITAFNGQITNDGTIVASSGAAALIQGYLGNGVYTGGFTNTGTISGGSIGLRLDGASLSDGITNDGGTITAPTAITTLTATGATTITNTGGGIIIGNVELAQNFADTFVGEDGGINGDIIGTGVGSVNDDSVVVQHGTQYFLGKASNLSSFTVDNGGTAIMGARFEGDLVHSGYSFTNVDAIHVNGNGGGGTLYIDRATTLNAGSYTQQAGGTLEFFLGAPGGAGFSALTGDQIANPSTDYGQVHVTGTASLNGTIAGFLDPAFASANNGLSSVTYNHVLVADGGITGDFTSLALISNNSLFELNEVLEGTTAVDLTVNRTSLGQIGGVPGIVVEIGGPWKSLVNDRSSGIGSGSCSLAGAGWCFNAFAANDTPGGGQVMNDATPGDDAFDWLRTGVRQTGETAVWGRAVGVWGDTSGDNVGHAGTNFDTYGAIVGVDHAFSQDFMAGAAAQWTKSNIDFSGVADKADVSSFEVGGYMSYGDARLYLNANASVIFHDINVTRFATGGAAFGNYNGTTGSGYAELGKIFETYEGFRIQPLVALSYAHLDTDSYNETGSAFTLLHVFDTSFDSLKSLVGARFGFPIATESGRKFVPEIRAIWAHEFMDDQSSFLANPISNPLNVALVTGQQYERDSAILGAGVTAPLSDATTLFLDYDATLSKDVTTNTVSAGLRTRW